MKPLLILDCDEVILRFVDPLARWLDAEHAIDLRLDSFALAGNMRHRDSGELVAAAQFPALLDGFFARGQHLQFPTDGAVAALNRLSETMDLVVLTNIGDAHREARRTILAGHGLALQVLANDGPKGRMVAELAEGRTAVFVDDLPPHHDSAARHAPHVGRLHMVGDPALRGLIPAAPQAHARIDDWTEAEPWIRQWMERNA